MSYLSKGPDDPGGVHPKYGVASNINFIYGGVLLVLCWAIKFVVILIDPSMPVLGPSFMWYRMSREKGFYDDTFFEP